VRARGWALGNQEWESDVCCAAAPVRDRRGDIVAALAVSLLARNYPCPSLAMASAAVAETAAEISVRLGWPRQA
jgi:DNA-binding IclR family transcriptional regulator